MQILRGQRYVKHRQWGEGVRILHGCSPRDGGRKPSIVRQGQPKLEGRKGGNNYIKCCRERWALLKIWGEWQGGQWCKLERVFQYNDWCRPQLDRYNSKHILNCYYVPDTFLSDLHILSYLILTTGLLNWLGSVGFKAENNFSLPDIVCKSHSLSSPWLPLVNILSRSSNFSWSLFRYHVRNYNPYINIMETMWWQREWKCSLLLKQNINWEEKAREWI